MSVTGRRTSLSGAGWPVPNDSGSSIVTSDISINSRFRIRLTNLGGKEPPGEYVPGSESDADCVCGAGTDWG